MLNVVLPPAPPPPPTLTKLRGYTRGTFHLPKIYGPTGWTANEPRGSNRNFPEQTDDRPSEVLHFFRSNRLERKLPFHLHNISISTAREVARAYTNLLRHHDLPMRLQVFHSHGKRALLLTRKISGISNRKFWLNVKRPSSPSSLGIPKSSNGGQWAPFLRVEPTRGAHAWQWIIVPPLILVFFKGQIHYKVKNI